MYPLFAILGGGYDEGWPRLILTHGFDGQPPLVATTPSLLATSQDYQQQLLDLLPPGPALNRELDGTIAQTLHGLAEVLTRIHNRALDLIREVDARNTTELLAAYERVAGLPEPCIDFPVTTQDRRDALAEKLTRRGRQDRQYFIDLAASLGFAITITEFRPFVAGMTAGLPVYGATWQWAWQVNAPTQSITFEFRAGSSAGSPLRDWGNEPLECIINRLKPAHTHAIFEYGG